MFGLSLLALLPSLLISTSDARWSTCLVVWAIRISVVSLLLRTYLIPWTLAFISKRVRIRSISFRSIRGLWICRAGWTVAVERIGYTVRDDGLCFVVEGLTVDIRRRSPPPSTPHPMRRSLTFHHISRLERVLWNILSIAYHLVNPLVRPFVRQWVISFLHVVLHKVPGKVTLEIRPFLATFPDASGSSFTADLVRLQTTVSFIQREKRRPYGPRPSHSRMPRNRPSYSIGAWKHRFQASVNRSWNTVLEETEGKAALSLHITGISGFTPTDNAKAPLFSLPGALDSEISMTFDPGQRRVDTHSLSASLGIGKCEIELKSLLAFLEQLKTKTSVDSTEDIPSTFPDNSSPSSPTTFSILSPTSPKSPWSAAYTIPSDASPRSPILKAFNRASMLARRNHYPPCMKLKETRSRAMISFLRSFKLDVEKIVVNIHDTGKDASSYKFNVHKIVLYAGLSDPLVTPLHRRWFGKSKRANHSFDPDVYTVTLSAGPLKFDRYTTHHHLRVLTMEPFYLDTLTTQFPSPWLVPSPFLGGDPNGPLLVVSLTLGNIQVTEQLDHISALFERLKTKHAPTQAPSHPTSDIFAVPRLAISAHCGTISARLVLPDTGHSHLNRVLEARTDGFVVSCNSHYSARLHPSHRGDLDALPLRLDLKGHFVLEPTFVRVRSKFTPSTFVHLSNSRTSDSDFLDDPVLLSLEQVAVFGKGSFLCEIRDDTHNIARVDSTTWIGDLSVRCDALCVELWHPMIMEGVIETVCALPSGGRSPSRTSSSVPLVDRLPTGLSASFFLGRALLFVAQPDINPTDDMEISRGVALRAEETLLEYCSMEVQHKSRFMDMHNRAEAREELLLPGEHLERAFSAAKASPTSPTASVMLNLADFSIRSALATPFESDDPTMAECDNPDLTYREFVRMRGIVVTTSLSSKEDSVICDASVQLTVNNSVITLSLSHLYHILLAKRNLEHLFPPKHPYEESHVSVSPPRVVLAFTLKFEVIQIYLGLPHERAALRLDAAAINLREQSLVIPRLTGWVFVRSHVSRWRDGTVRGRWRELASLKGLSMSMASLDGKVGGQKIVDVCSQAAHIRVPHGYVPADLIQDIGVSVKAARHLLHLVKDGVYRDFPAPEAEGPKHLPPMKVTLLSFCLELEDDPFEQKLALNLQTGMLAAKSRLEREKAFEAKVMAIVDPGGHAHDEPLDHAYEFSSDHTISISEARARFEEVHSIDWVYRHRAAKATAIAQQDAIMESFLTETTPFSRWETHNDTPNIVKVASNSHLPPLFRAIATGLVISTSAPSFPASSLVDFLHSQGDLPRDTEYSLLVPLHLKFTVTSVRVTLRDYPIPLVEVLGHYLNNSTPALEFDSDLVIAEEMGSSKSVQWVKCPVSDDNDGIHGATSLVLSVPKTIMSVKTYANPEIQITTPEVTTIGWGVSYGPATQDLMRVLDTITSAPRDESPGLGFWDKMRLVFHWSIRASFKGEVRYHMKGLRDPKIVSAEGAGFLLSWQGHTKLLIGRANEDRETIQVISDTMMIAIPNFQYIDSTATWFVPKAKPFKKICAKVVSGVRFGIGFAFERTCGVECSSCSGSAFQRQCRLFEFRPHHKVRLEKKVSKPELGSPEDSFHGFRSDFIHLSISLTSSVRSSKNTHPRPSSLYLTPQVFAQFWTWWQLFDGAMSLPIRQGSFFPRKIVSPKFGRHIATIKYRIAVKALSIFHGYIDDGRETWASGVVPWVGVKALIDEFQVDMHQRDTETSVPGIDGTSTKIVRHKPFYAAEVVMKGLDLRAIMATFAEPLKKLIPVHATPQQQSNYRTRNKLTDSETPLTSSWYDQEDYIEVDWTSSVPPEFYVIPVVSCPHFMYFKRNSALLERPSQTSKFGNESTHICLLGTEPSVPQTQKHMAEKRVEALRALLGTEDTTIEKKITLLQQYILQLDTPELSHHSFDTRAYQIPSDTVSPDEWAEFENVYQIHCPKISLDSAIRDIMMQYYYCSRDRRGLEYHLSARAVKFILDQAKAAVNVKPSPKVSVKESAANTAQAAAMALKNLLMGDRKDSEDSFEYAESEASSTVDPLHGWSDGVTLSKSHCCLLLKPQIILQNREKESETCVVSALQAKLQSFAIMDELNAKDPISGKVMSRTFTVISGLQTFAPTALSRDLNCVPLEVLIDFRCESDDFDRLVPQTDATFHYDKFNRLRLRNNVTSVMNASKQNTRMGTTHLQDQTDLIKVNIPKFTVTASDLHFKTISNVLTKLLLFSDAAHKTRVDKLETLLFTYDFTDLGSAAKVILDVQDRLRDAMMIETLAQQTIDYEQEAQVVELFRLKAHIYLLSDELNLIFDAIKLAQDRYDDTSDRKSALLLHTSSSEISWNMLDESRELLAKMVVQDIDYYWLSQQDSSTVNNLTVGNLQAFDGSKDAVWAEIVSKYDDPPNHALLRRQLFLVSDWSILPPVGGITIYENFDLNLHPMRLQVDAKVGRRIMEYLFPARRTRNITEQGNSEPPSVPAPSPHRKMFPPSRTSLESNRMKSHSRQVSESDANKLALPAPANGLRRLGTSRSFTNLREAAKSEQNSRAPSLARTRSTELLSERHARSADNVVGRLLKKEGVKQRGDAAEMRTRSSQKTFVLVRISSLHVLLSMMKEDSFVCHEARITTRDLEYRNQTWSFEELVDQFIPSDTSWKGWVKMAFQQPLVPVLPVARELLKKTKLIPTAKHQNTSDPSRPSSPFRPRMHLLPSSAGDDLASDRAPSPSRGWRRSSKRPLIPDAPFTTEPEDADGGENANRPGPAPTRHRMLSILTRNSDKSGRSNSSNGSTPSVTSTSTSSSSTSSKKSQRSREDGA